ncbi:MAG: hypothetical protein Q9183_003746 [Haloplaca sp. 2 TL-2023]
MASVPPSPSPSSPPSASPAKPLHPSPTYLSKTTAHINHINRLISTTANLDLTLSTLGYTLAFLSTILPSPTPTSSSPPLRKTTSIQNPKLVSPLRLPSLFHLRASLSEASPRLKILASLISEARTILRLFGLLSLFPAIASTLSALLEDMEPVFKSMGRIRIPGTGWSGARIPATTPIFPCAQNTRYSEGRAER